MNRPFGLQNMIKELSFIGEPIEFKKGILLYPPKIKQVITTSNFNLFVNILTLSQEQIEDELYENGKWPDNCPSPFEFLLINSYCNEAYEKIAKEAFKFFTKEEVTFLYDLKKIVIGNLNDIIVTINSLDDLIVLEEKEFFDFQNLIRDICGLEEVAPYNPNEHPKIKEMKRKARLRDKVKMKQNKDGYSFHTLLVSICCMGIGITPLNIGEMSYSAAMDILSKFQDKEKYELDINMLLAGGDAKQIKPKYWIRNFNE